MKLSRSETFAPLTVNERACLLHHSARELRAIERALTLGCAWHGAILSDGCAECDTIHFHREVIGREAVAL